MHFNIVNDVLCILHNTAHYNVVQNNTTFSYDLNNTHIEQQSPKSITISIKVDLWQG